VLIELHRGMITLLDSRLAREESDREQGVFEFEDEELK